MDSWAGNSLGFVAATGVLTQLYPSWTTVGVAKASATNGQLILGPSEGILHSIQIMTDGTNGGIIEIWDVNADDLGVDVSTSLTPTFTNANLVSLQTLNRAKLLYTQNVVATGVTPPAAGYRPFQHGLAARFVGAAGAVTLNLEVAGGFRKTEKVG